MTPDDEPLDSGPSVRERRAARARTGREFSWRPLKPYLAVAVVILVAVGVWALVEYGPRRAPPKGDHVERIHHHASFKMFAEGQEITFRHCAFDLDGCEGWTGTNFPPGHLHANEAVIQVLHIEHQVGPGLRNLTLGRFFESIHVNFTNERVTLDSDVHDGQTYAGNATHAWQLWVNYCIDPPTDWVHVLDMRTYEPQQHDRMLLTFAPRSWTEDDLASQLDAVPSSTDISSITGDACPNVVGTTTSIA